MMRPTRRAVFLFSTLLPLPWILLVWRPSLWFLAFNLSALVLLAIATDGLFAYPRKAVSLELHAPASAYIGERVEASLEIKTTKGRRPAWFEVALDLAGDAQPELAVNPFLVAGAPHRETVNITPRRRGILEIGAVWLRWHGPFGLMENSRRFPTERAVRILPNIRAARTASLDFFSRDALFGMKMQWAKGEGSEFEALREYAPGLDTRFIDWKHSARHRKLLTKDFRAERNHPVILAYDTGYLMREPLAEIPRLDYAINSGLLLAWLALRSGDLVGTYAFDSVLRQFVTPTRGLRSFRHLQQSSASLAYSEEETNFTLGLAELHSRLRRRTLIVLFTEFIDTVTAELLIENLQRLTGRHLVVFVTLRDVAAGTLFDDAPTNPQQMARVILSDDFERDRSLVLEKLQRIGVHCLDVPPARLSASLLNKYLAIKQRGLL